MAIDYGALESGRGVNYWEIDPVLQREVRRTYPPDARADGEDLLAGFGEAVGTTMADNSDLVDEHPPRLRTYDRDGEVVNEVEYHPAHLENVRLTYEHGAVADSFRAPPGREEPMPLTHNLAAGYLLGEIDVGLDCPMAMTAGAALVLEKYGDGGLQPYLDGLVARDHDDLLTGAMFLTEKQGGSDVGANETVAEHVEGRTYHLTGEKWFCSNVDAGVALALARRPDAPAGTDGLSLFVVPRETAAGEPNDYLFRRLKDKLGTKSVPTGEVELEGAEAYLVGEPERGFKYMAEMLNVERLHNAVGSVGLVARALLESRVHVEDREAFGGPLAEKPLMRRDLADLAADHEAAAAFTFEAAAAFDRYHRDDGQAPPDLEGLDAEAAYRLMRLLVPVAKHRTGRLAVDAASYAIEIQGGNGYTDDWVTSRLLRDAQVLPVWEGTSNVLSLDVLRALATEAAHEPALDRIRECLAEATAAPLGDLVETVRSELEGLSDALGALATADRETAEFHAKAFADYVFDVYAAALLLAEAQRDLDAGDGRKAAVARWFVERHLRSPHGRGIPAEPRLPVAHFEAINYHAQLDPTALDVEAPAAD